MNTVFKIIGIVVGVGALIVGVVCLEAWIFMLLANWALGLFKVAFTFSFVQSIGAVILLSFIGSFFKNSSSN